MASSGNFATLNPLIKSSTNTFSNGHCRITSSSGGWGSPLTLAANTGKFYVEINFVVSDTNGGRIAVLPTNSAKYNDGDQSAAGAGEYAIEWKYDGDSNFITNNGSTTQSNVGSWAQGDVAAVAFDLDASPKTVQFYKNNSTIGSAENINTSAIGPFTVMIYAHNAGTWHINAGQDSTFGGNETAGGNADGNGFGDFYYSPPSGFLALSSANLPVSDDIDPAQTDDNFPAKNFAPILYTGTGSNGNAITGLGFKPDLVFFQRRGATGAYNNGLIDSNRGVTKGHYMNRTDAEANFTNDFASFDSDGFTLQAGSSANINNPSTTFVAWCWRANEGTTTSDSSGDITVTRQVNDAAKFSICTWTGNGSSGSTLPHGLGAVPRMTWIKKRDLTSSTNIWHASFNNADPDSFGEPVGSAAWYANQGVNGTFTTAPDATNLTLTAYGQVNGSSNTYVGYFWADVEGMQKFGGYKGNGDADGPFVYTGFRPAMIFFKRTDGTSGWTVVDTARYTANTTDGPGRLEWNTTAAEVTGSSALREMDILANGFKIKTSNSNINTSGGDYVYGAWASVPFKYNNTL